jgi:iduronate 2-sulfatase
LPQFATEPERIPLFVKYSFRWFYTSFLCVSLLFSSENKPNILFIAVDDLRPQLGCYGDQQIISPNIDGLAKQGTVFNQAYCQVPVCGASRASLLTGLRPTPKRFRTYKSKANEDAPGITDLPGWFKKQGYETYSMGKIYHHRNDNGKSWTQIGDKLITKKGIGDYKLKESKAPKGTKGWGGGLPYEAADVPEKEYFTHQLADAAISRLRDMKKRNKPTFLAVGFTKPHLPFVAPKKYWDLYPKKEITLATNPFAPKGSPRKAMHNFGELRSYKGVPQKGPVSDELAIKLKHGYFACISFVDAMIGRILGELDRLDMRKNTVIVLWGDHGWQLGEHSLWCKHANFHTSLNAPLIVSAPGMAKGQRLNQLVEFVDIYPTLCDLSKLSLPQHLEGQSFVPLLEGKQHPWKEAIFSRYHDGDSVKTERYLYTRWQKQGKMLARMLYDHKLDPLENTNISESPDSAQIIDRMEQYLEKGWRPIAKKLPKQ